MSSNLNPSSTFFVDESAPISLFENVCNGGAFTVWLAILFFVSFVGIRIYLHEKSPKKPVDRNLTNSYFERLFVAPFTPRNLESLVAFVYVAWFLMTITFGLTRFYKRKWASETMAQQGPFNILAWFFGCKGIDPLAAFYTNVQETTLIQDRRGPFGLLTLLRRKKNGEKSEEELSMEDMDFFFSHHIAFGVLWLTVGALQLYQARSGWSEDRDTRHVAHKYFGRVVAGPAFICHMIMATVIAFRNPVNQHAIITYAYKTTVLESVLLFVSGIRWAVIGSSMKETDRKWSEHLKPRFKTLDNFKSHCYAKHMVRMFFCWIHSVAGSGSVRLAIWIIFLISKFFGTETKILLDRGSCQAMASVGYPAGCLEGDPGCLVPISSITADSMHCWKPVFLNLLLMDLTIVYVEWLFLRLDSVVVFGQNNDGDFAVADKMVTVMKFQRWCVLGAVSLVWIFFIPISGMSNLLLQCFIFVYCTIVKSHALAIYAADYVQYRENEGTMYYTLLWVIAKIFGVAAIGPPHTPVDAKKSQFE